MEKDPHAFSTIRRKYTLHTKAFEDYWLKRKVEWTVRSFIETLADAIQEYLQRQTGKLLE